MTAIPVIPGRRYLVILPGGRTCWVCAENGAHAIQIAADHLVEPMPCA